MSRTTLLPHWLWIGDLDSAACAQGRLVCWSSKFRADAFAARAPAMDFFWLEVGADSALAPERVNQAIWTTSSEIMWFAGGRPGYMPELVPTYVLCDGGTVAATALAACWLLAYGLCFVELSCHRSSAVPEGARDLMSHFRAPAAGFHPGPLPESPVDELTSQVVKGVEGARAADLAADGLELPALSPIMRANVRAYCEWLVRGCRPELGWHLTKESRWRS